MTIDRRTLLVAAGATAALTAFPSPATAAPHRTPDAPGLRRWNADRSDNGWPIGPEGITEYAVEGSPVTVRLHREASAVLLHVARRWHYEVLPLRGAADILGYSEERAVPAAYGSNRLSGSAIVLPGAGDGLWPHQTAVVRDILADCEGVVRWGADLAPAAPGHFQIDVRPGTRTLARLATALREGPARGDAPRTGAPEDPAAPERRTQAGQLARAQRPAG